MKLMHKVLAITIAAALSGSALAQVTAKFAVT